MRSLKIYFAAAMYGGREYAAEQGLIVDALQRLGHCVLSEHVADEELARQLFASSDAVGVYEADMAWVDEADVVVAEVSTPSLGVGLEVGYALYALDKPVICLCMEKAVSGLSLMIKGNTHPRLSWYVYNRENVEVALEECLAEFARTRREQLALRF